MEFYVQLLLVAAGVMLFRAVSYVWRGPRRRSDVRRMMIVLGSGGHTGEMIGTLRHVDAAAWEHRTTVYVVSETDKDSAGAADLFERERMGRAARILRIPRAREVGQSYITSVFTTLRALAACVILQFDEDPDVVITNGPGVCIPVVFAALLVAYGMNRTRPSTVYFESFTCVDHVSVSGAIMRRIADVFTVQWRQLEAVMAPNRQAASKKERPYRTQQRVGGAHGNLFFTGPDFRTSPNVPLLPNGFHRQPAPRDREPLCLVTVGSTKFDDLMHAIDTLDFYDALVGLGIRDLIIQRGRSEYTFRIEPPNLLMASLVVQYKPNLAADIRRASLVISHAGAGTILEAMGAATPTIVVPNERLMSNHQVQLAVALAEERFLFTCRTGELIDMLRSADWSTLRKFPPPNVQAVREALSVVL